MVRLLVRFCRLFHLFCSLVIGYDEVSLVLTNVDQSGPCNVISIFHEAGLTDVDQDACLQSDQFYFCRERKVGCITM